MQTPSILKKFESRPTLVSDIALASPQADLSFSSGRVHSRSPTSEPERARHTADQNAINLPRFRHRSSSLLPGTRQGSDNEDSNAEPAPFTIDGIVRENTDSLLGKGARRRSGTGSLLLAGGMNDSSFSANEAGIDFAPVDLGFDLGMDLPP